ncbi:angiopoietin-related protein 3-like [Drosophila hydei]|uniref:Angiopoietin-related protein 3-like n=1 Tax=Drosophila hydei TaxID=7224 RepID=A0A6J1LR83_DROHY|nr:angiopoietin-related protein 3-like [Drosophila hydei]
MDMGELQSRNLQSEFSVKCFGIIQSLLQDIEIKKEKFVTVVQGKDNKLSELQGKYDQVQMKLAVAETVARQKESQILQQRDLCNSHRNNSHIKDELLTAYRQHVKDKAAEIAELQKELKEQAEILFNFTSQTKQKDAQIEQLQAIQLIQDENMSKSAAQIEQLKSQLETKDTFIESLQSKILSYNIKAEELQSNLKNRDAQIEKLQAELKKKLEERDAFSLQLNASELLNEQKISEVSHLRSELNQTQLQLSKYEDQLDNVQLINCYWYGNSSAIRQIRAPGIKPFDVLCDSQLAGQGWAVIQRRFDGSENFYRNWSEYRDGFGDLHGEFFIGLEKIYRLTLAQPNELYVHLEDFNNSVYYAKYSDFGIASESEKCRRRALLWQKS